MGERDPEGHWGTGFFPGGVWEYQKTFVAAPSCRGKRVLLEFEGVYRSASVWVNGALVGHRPVRILGLRGVDRRAPPLRRGEHDQVLTRPSHDDARWYSGAGHLPTVHLIVGEPVHLALDGVHGDDAAVDDDGAMVAVATVVENESLITTTTTVTTEIVDDSGAVVARDVAPLTMFPGRAETLRQRTARRAARAVERRLARPVHVPHRARGRRRRARPRVDDASASARSRSTPRAACASTAKRSSCAGRASTTTTA